MLSIVTWNVNSIRSRLQHLLAFIDEEKPDIVLLQELKCTVETFPFLEIEERGYNVAMHGEKTYNGVAILSKFPLDDVIKGLPGNEDDTQARYIEAVVSIGKRQEAGGKSEGGAYPLLPPASCLLPSFTAIRIASAYIPNGQEAGSEKFAYKLQFLERLRAHARTLLTLDEPVILGGDYNVAPWPEDVYDPVKLDGTVCYHPEERARLRAMLNDGWYDALHHTGPAFTWWDYRANALAANHGYRIDHLLLSPHAADALKQCRVHTATRAQEKASDHAPVIGGFGF